MELKPHYRKYEELIKKYKLAIDPDNETFLIPKDKIKTFKQPEGYEHWKFEEYDFEAYGKERLEEMEISEEQNYIELYGGKNIKENELVNQRVFFTAKNGDIEILQYSLKRKCYTEGENKERYVFQTRLHPTRANLYAGKYDYTFAKNKPFWHESLIVAFEEEKEIDTLVITEGQFKAFKASHDGIPTVGITSITHYAEKATGSKIHQEIIEFIHTCKVKKVVILWDGDCRDISSKDLEQGHDISKRINLFFRSACKVRELIKEFTTNKLKIHFATINSSLVDNPKGIDDLLISHKQHKTEIAAAFENIGVLPSVYIESVDFTIDEGIKKLKAFLKINHVNAFYQFHKEQIKGKSFIFLGSNYKVEDGNPVMEISADIKVYKRIGFNFYRTIMSPIPSGKDGTTSLEECLVPWTSTAIVQDHGKNVITHIERFDDFTNIASHINYQQVINNHWNLYYNIDHKPEPGPFVHIDKLLKHLFEDQYEMILDYISILYRNPMQKLPVVCLVSKQQNTGKSTFVNLMKLIFKQNMANINNKDLEDQFDSHWTSKLIVACEETMLEKPAAYERIKSLSTAQTVSRNEKNKTSKEIPNMLHFIFCSNHEDNFLRIDDNDSRLWIRKIKSIQERILNFDDKIEEEIKFFVHFIQEREIVYQYRDRLYFHPDDFKTDAFRNVVSHSEPNVIKEIRLQLEDYFHKYKVEKIMLTAGNLNKYFNIKGESFYLNRVIKDFLKVNRYTNLAGKEVVHKYSFQTENSSNAEESFEVKQVGRPYVFFRSDFIKKEDETFDDASVIEIPFDEIPKEIEADAF